MKKRDAGNIRAVNKLHAEVTGAEKKRVCTSMVKLENQNNTNRRTRKKKLFEKKKKNPQGATQKKTGVEVGKEKTKVNPKGPLLGGARTIS